MQVGASPFTVAQVFVSSRVRTTGSSFTVDMSDDGTIHDCSSDQPFTILQSHPFHLPQAEDPAKPDMPPAPRILCRSPVSITLTHLNLQLRKCKPPASYEVYCKKYGAGIALTLGKVNAEYPGAGKKIPVGSPVTLDGLQVSPGHAGKRLASQHAFAMLRGGHARRWPALYSANHALLTTNHMRACVARRPHVFQSTATTATLNLFEN